MAAVLKFFKSILGNLKVHELNIYSLKKLPVLLFRFVYIEPQKGNDWKGKCRYFAKIIFLVLSLIISIVSVALKIVLAAQSEDLSTSLIPIMNVCLFTLNNFKVFNTYLRRHEILKIFQDIPGRKYCTNKNYHLKKYMENYIRLMILYSAPIALLVTADLFKIIPFLINGTMMNLTIDYWYPFDEYQVQTFPIAYIWVNWGTLFILPVMYVGDVMLYGLVTVVSMEFLVLKIDLMRLGHISEYERTNELRQLIDRHNNLLRLRDRLQEIYSITFLFSFMISSIIMCLLAFLLSGATDIASCVFYFCVLWMTCAQTLLLCVFGQKLINSTESIPDGIYSCGWETFKNHAFKKQLILITMQAQRAKRLTAMNFAEISLETFTQILTATGSYFSLLRSVDDK